MRMHHRERVHPILKVCPLVQVQNAFRRAMVDGWFIVKPKIGTPLLVTINATGSINRNVQKQQH